MGDDFIFLHLRKQNFTRHRIVSEQRSSFLFHKIITNVLLSLQTGYKLWTERICFCCTQSQNLRTTLQKRICGDASDFYPQDGGHAPHFRSKNPHLNTAHVHDRRLRRNTCALYLNINLFSGSMLNVSVLMTLMLF